MFFPVIASVSEAISNAHYKKLSKASKINERSDLAGEERFFTLLQLSGSSTCLIALKMKCFASFAITTEPNKSEFP